TSFLLRGGRPAGGAPNQKSEPALAAAGGRYTIIASFCWRCKAPADFFTPGALFFVPPWPAFSLYDPPGYFFAAPCRGGNPWYNSHTAPRRRRKAGPRRTPTKALFHLHILYKGGPL